MLEAERGSRYLDISKTPDTKVYQLQCLIQTQQEKLPDTLMQTL